jgi:hypothetical protein
MKTTGSLKTFEITRTDGSEKENRRFFDSEVFFSEKNRHRWFSDAELVIKGTGGSLKFQITAAHWSAHLSTRIKVDKNIPGSVGSRY